VYRRALRAGSPAGALTSPPRRGPDDSNIAGTRRGARVVVARPGRYPGKRSQV
jgi:hypothetical protein